MFPAIYWKLSQLSKSCCGRDFWFNSGHVSRVGKNNTSVALCIRLCHGNGLVGFDFWVKGHITGMRSYRNFLIPCWCEPWRNTWRWRLEMELEANWSPEPAHAGWQFGSCLSQKAAKSGGRSFCCVVGRRFWHVSFVTEALPHLYWLAIEPDCKLGHALPVLTSTEWGENLRIAGR